VDDETRVPGLKSSFSSNGAGRISTACSSPVLWLRRLQPGSQAPAPCSALCSFSNTLFCLRTPPSVPRWKKYRASYASETLLIFAQLDQLFRLSPPAHFVERSLRPLATFFLSLPVSTRKAFPLPLWKRKKVPGSPTISLPAR